MMTFYAAAGCYRIKDEDGHKVPYIQKLGKLHPISIPEFVIWSTLLWEVMTYQELEKCYNEQIKAIHAKTPDFDEMLSLLVKRKLIVRGVGYTGQDALYNMLSDAFIVPCQTTGARKVMTGLKLVAQGKLPVSAFIQILTMREHGEMEKRVMQLVKQTPLSTAEIVRCCERDIWDVSSSDKVLSGIYPEFTQAEIAQHEALTNYTIPVMKAVSNLYLGKQIIFEVA